MFTEIGEIENFSIVNTQDASVFDDLDSLLTFAAIVFSNTSGNNLLNATQRQNMEDYIAAGRGFLGIHAATDTYRNGSWPFYNELVGAIVQSSPNHTSRFHVDTMTHQLNHPVLYQIPDPWIKQEEYYYWDLNGGMIDSNVTPALHVLRTGMESYDRERPITWFRQFDSGSRSFYTALGHDQSNFTDPDNDFRQLVRNGLCWVAKASDGLMDPTTSVVADNDIYLRDSDQGVILRSDDGSCWRLTVNNSGLVSAQPVTCPK